MAERFNNLDDSELGRALADLGRHVSYPPTPNLALRVRNRVALQPARRAVFGRFSPSLQRRFALALVVFAVLGGALLALSPEARTVVAGRLGVRGVQIAQVQTPSALGRELGLGQSMTLEQARAQVAFQVEGPGALGVPDAVYFLNLPTGGQVALVYAARVDLPQANTTGVGLLLTEFQGDVHSTGVFGKGLPAGTRLEEVQVSGGRGYWIEGDPHFFFFVDAAGRVQSETTRLAGNVLLWEHGLLTLRMESALARDRALSIASSVQLR